MNVLAADVGGTTVHLGLVSEAGVVDWMTVPADAERGMLSCLETIASGWETLMGRCGMIAYDFEGAGMALPFVVETCGARVKGDFGKFPGAVDVNYHEWCRQRLGMPLVIENDLRMALIGERHHGAARDCTDVVMLALGTGIGCAAVCGGHLLRGARNLAASMLGHMTVAYDSPIGRCGAPGCAEDLASTATLTARAGNHPAYPHSHLAQAGQVDFEELFIHAETGDRCSIELLDESLKVWAAVARNVVLAYDPQVLILGGGILRRSDVVIPAIRESLSHPIAGVAIDIPVVEGFLGDQAALLGCYQCFANSTRNHA